MVRKEYVLDSDKLIEKLKNEIIKLIEHERDNLENDSNISKPELINETIESKASAKAYRMVISLIENLKKGE